MNKRKVLLLALAVCMVAILAVGGTLAYFTDEEKAHNTFVVGKIDIELQENNGEWLEEQDPDNYHENDDYREWLTENEQQFLPDRTLPKYVSVDNVGTRPAYTWVEIWIPADLDNTNSLDMLSWQTNWVHYYLQTKKISGVDYNGYIVYRGDGVVNPGENSDHYLDEVHMSKHVVQCTTHKDCMILADGTTHYTGSWDLYINAVGFQQDMIESIHAALDNYYGKTTADAWWTANTVAHPDAP